MTEKPCVSLPGMVEKIIKSLFPGEPEEAQITVQSGDHHQRLERQQACDDVLRGEVGLPQGHYALLLMDARNALPTSHPVFASSYWQVYRWETQL
jgi:hypothetical protein